MAAPRRTRRAPAGPRATTTRRPARAQRQTSSAPASSSATEQLLSTAAAHPIMTLTVLALAGTVISALVARPDPRRLANAAQSLQPYATQALAPLLAAAMPEPRHWWDDLVPFRRKSWAERAADEARSRWQDAADAIPPRRWWEDQFSELTEALRKRLPKN